MEPSLCTKYYIKFPEFPSAFHPVGEKAFAEGTISAVERKTEISSVLPDFFQTLGSPVFHQEVPVL